MYKKILVGIALIFVSACSAVGRTPTQTVVPTNTSSAPSPSHPLPSFTNTTSYTQTPTATPTLTATPAPTVFGGGRRGKIVFISNRDGNKEIYIMNSDGSGQTRLTHTDGSETSPSWSPDGAKIAFVSHSVPGSFAIFTMNPDGSDVQQLTGPTDSSGDRFSWAPDGSKIVYESIDTKPVDADIVIINLDGSGQKNLTRDFHRQEMMPDWSPDGRRISYREYGMDDKYIINADGTVLLKLDREISPPVWAPDGLNFLFTKDHEIFLENVLTQHVTQLTRNKNYEFDPIWSPDGQEIAFISTRNQGAEEIFIMNRDGSNVRQASNFHDNRITVYKMIWSPDQTKIVFEYTNRNGNFNFSISILDIKTHEWTNLSNNKNYDDSSPSLAP